MHCICLNEPYHGNRAVIANAKGKPQTSLNIRAVLPEPMLLAHVNAWPRDTSANELDMRPY